jgi:hypothetical protein
MSRPPEVTELRPTCGDQRVREKRRSLKDVFLTLAWVTTYAAILQVFRFAKAIETRHAGQNEATLGDQNKDKSAGQH